MCFDGSLSCADRRACVYALCRVAVPVFVSVPVIDLVDSDGCCRALLCFALRCCLRAHVVCAAVALLCLTLLFMVARCGPLLALL